MSMFIKLEREELEDIRSRIKGIQNALFNLKSDAIIAKKETKEKSMLAQRGSLLINEAHEELAKLVSFMPQLNEFSLLRLQDNIASHDFKKLKPIGKDVNKDEVLRKLRERISGLK